MSKSTGYWLIVASRDHVFAGIKGNFSQASHGRSSPLDKMNADDWIVYYSPKKIYGDTKPYQKFVAIAKVTGEEVFQVKLSESFKPYRREVRYCDDIHETDIRPLIPQLHFIKKESRWGLSLRNGFLSIPEEDFRLICSNMRD
ncbi:EVE domain-containing protein [Methanolobus bombayensis]|uniref:EVE domain-containing protein n=1 Tax=Methanolobus bombayensis TaxID=38023 RepID=UPI001AE476D2|nr:putative RNA-binding protein [Methanolobus bombayensis]